MNNGKTDIRGVFFDNVDKKEALERAKELITRDGVDVIYTPNSEIVQMCIDDNALYDVINSASLIIPDGIGVVYASKILGTPLKEKVAGIELAQDVLSYLASEGLGVYLFGSSPARDGIDAVCDIAKKKLLERYPGLVVSGTHDGYFKSEETDEIIKGINESGASVLFVCLGAPKQEKWIYDNRDKLKVSLCMGLGGSLDVFAGTVKRAPDFFVKANLEWFYRLIKQPARIGRMMNLPRFLFGTIATKGKDKR